MNKHIFLSYSHQDGDSMHQLREDLTTLGATIWTDERLVIGTPSWKKAVEQALDDAIAVVVLLSPSAKVSIWVEEEVNYAKLHEIPILPVLIRGEEIDAIPFGLTGAQLIDLRNSNTYLENLKRLKQAILSMRSRAQRGESPHDAMDRVETSTAQTYSQHSYRREVADILSYYTQVFVGRGEEVSLIEAFGAQEQPGYLLLEAPSGYGKSALVANLIIQYERGLLFHGTNPLLLYYFIRRDGHQDSSSAFLQSINLQMQWDLGRTWNATSDLASLRLQFLDLWENVLRTRNGHVLLLIDGIDEMERDDITIAHMLPRRLPPFAHVIVTSRPNPEPLQQVNVEHPLAQARVTSIRAFRESEVEQLLHYLSAANGQSAHDTTAYVTRVLGITKGDPLFSRFVCQELATAGKDAYHRLLHLEHNPPSDVIDYFRRQFKQLDTLVGNSHTWDLLCLVGTSLGGITEQEMAEALGLSKREVRLALQPVLRYFIGRTRYQLMHWLLRKAILEDLTEQEVENYRSKLLQLCRMYRARNWPQNTPDYVLTHFASHLAIAGCTEELYGLVSKSWMHTLLIRTHSHAAFARDMNIVIKAAKQETPSNLFQIAKASMIYASIGSLADNLPSESLGALAGAGEIGRAQETVDLMQYESSQSAAYDAIVRDILARDPRNDEPSILERAMTIAEDMGLQRYIPTIRARLAYLASQKHWETTPYASVSTGHGSVSLSRSQVLELFNIEVIALARDVSRAPTPMHAEELIKATIADATGKFQDYRQAQKLAFIAEAMIVIGEYERAISIVEDIYRLVTPSANLDKLPALLAVLTSMKTTRDEYRKESIAQWILSTASAISEEPDRTTYIESIVATFTDVRLYRHAIAAASMISDPRLKFGMLRNLAVRMTSDGADQEAEHILKAAIKTGYNILQIAPPAPEPQEGGKHYKRQVAPTYPARPELVSSALVLPDEYLSGDMLHSIALHLAYKGDTTTAMKTARLIPNKRVASTTLNGIALILRKNGDRQGAKRAVAAAWKLARSVTFYEGEAMAMSEVLITQARLKQFDDVLRLTPLVLRVIDLVKHPHSKAQALTNVIAALTRARDFDQAYMLTSRIAVAKYRTVVIAKVDEARRNLHSHVGQEEQASVAGDTSSAGRVHPGMLQFRKHLLANEFDHIVTAANEIASHEAEGQSEQDVTALDLCEVAHELALVGARIQALEVASAAFALARMSGSGTVFGVLEYLAPLLFSVDLGDTLWDICNEFQEIEGWWAF